MSTKTELSTFVVHDVMIPGTATTEATFQYNVYLPQTDWFYQPGDNTTLWLSIQAVELQPSFYEWGWKTRPHFFQDDAFSGFGRTGWRPTYGPDGLSLDLALEISTAPKPSNVAAISADLTGIAAHFIRRRHK